MPTDKKNIHTGHRERMREKLELHGHRIFATYELLEMLLYYTVPCKNTNPTAKELMLKFGDLEGIFAADREMLKEVDGVGTKASELIFGVGNFTRDLFSMVSEDKANPFLSYKSTGDFLVDYFASEEGHKVSVMLLNSRMEKLSVTDLYSVDYSSAKVKADAIIDLAISGRAAVAIIAHTHPFGPLYPTVGDIETNKMVEDALARVGVALIEHYIISGNAYVGFMQHLHTAFSQTPEIEGFLSSKEG